MYFKRTSNALQTYPKRASSTPQTHLKPHLKSFENILKRIANAPRTYLTHTSNAPSTLRTRILTASQTHFKRSICTTLAPSCILCSYTRIYIYIPHSIETLFVLWTLTSVTVEGGEEAERRRYLASANRNANTSARWWRCCLRWPWPRWWWWQWWRPAPSPPSRPPPLPRRYLDLYTLGPYPEHFCCFIFWPHLLHNVSLTFWIHILHSVFICYFLGPYPAHVLFVSFLSSRSGGNGDDGNG